MAEETVKTDTEKVVYPCSTCQLDFSNKTILDAHLSGSKHQKKIIANQLLTKLQQTESCFTHDPATGTFLCLVCNIEVTSPQLLETHFSGTKHKNKASDIGGTDSVQPNSSNKRPQQPITSGKPQQQPIASSKQPQDTSNGQAGKRQLTTAAPPAKRVAPTEGGTFDCKDCQKSFNSEMQMTQHLSSKKHLNRCLIAMFGTCNIQDTLTKSTRGRGGRGNNRGRGRGRGGGGGRGRPNYQTSSEWEANGPMRGNSRPVDYGSNGLIQRTPDWGGCDCGNRGRVRSNQGHQQRAYSTAWDDNYDNVSYNNQSGFVNHGGYSDDSATYIEPSTVTSNTYTNPNHYSNQNVYSDQSVSNTQGRSRSIGTGVNRVSVYERSSGGQGGYQQRIVGEQGWNKSGQSQGGGKGYQGGRGRGRGRGYQTH